MRVSGHSVFDAEARTRVNTINTKGVMGAGIALEFRLRHPDMFQDYAERCERDEVHTGRPYLYGLSTGDWVLNFPTKRDWRRPSRIEWIQQGLVRVQEMDSAGELEGPVAFPRLGTSHGGLDPETVESLMKGCLQDLSVEVVLCLDHEPRPGGTEATMLRHLSTLDASDLQREFGLNKRVATNIADAGPLDRFRQLSEVRGVGKKTYASLFRALLDIVETGDRTPSSNGTQATLF